MRVVDVSKCLDKKLTVMGYEVFDVLLIFLVLSILNLIFGQSSLSIVFVWLPTAFLALVLRLGKKGKPEKHLVHTLRFLIAPPAYSAFHSSKSWEPPPKLRKDGICR